MTNSGMVPLVAREPLEPNVMCRAVPCYTLLMYADVVDLRDFYTGRLGQVARRMIRRRIRLIWPNLAGMRLLGLAHATPHLNLFREEAERGVPLIPPPPGVLPRPSHRATPVP